MSSVKEFTDGNYTELKNKGNRNVITGDFMSELTQMLRKCGIKCQTLKGYDELAEDAVMEFQYKNGLPTTGILDDKTLEKLQKNSAKVSDVVSSVKEATEMQTESDIKNPHFDSWFDLKDEKIFRKNHKDIKITFGNNSVVKTIKDVFMISQSVEVDTSGNPIYETYQFMARDIIESDDPSDSNKYNGNLISGTNGYSSSDIKYNYADLN